MIGGPGIGIGIGIENRSVEPGKSPELVFLGIGILFSPPFSISYPLGPVI